MKCCYRGEVILKHQITNKGLKLDIVSSISKWKGDLRVQKTDFRLNHRKFDVDF